MPSTGAISKEKVLLECPCLLQWWEHTEKGTFATIDFQHGPPNRTFGDFIDERETVNDHLRQSGMEWPAVYKIFIDRIEFDSDALEKYLKIPLQAGSHTAGRWVKIPLRSDGPELRKIIDEGDPIPEIIFFKDIKQITICETETSWLKKIGANHYEVSLKNGQNVKIPWDFRYRHELETHGLHMWWEELRDGRAPEGLMAYKNFVAKKTEAENYQKRLDSAELKNTCGRCGKVWYLGAGELQDLENRLGTSKKILGQMGNIGMVSALFNPMLSAQMQTSSAANLGALQDLQKEFEEKSRCPECQSRNIERELVEEDEKVHNKEKIIGKTSGSLAEELKKLSELKEQGILDEDEFKSAKQKLIENQ